MVMLSAASALVAGSVAAEDAMKTQTIKVRRPFWLNGKQHFAGAVLEVPAVTAAELVAMGKAEKSEPAPPKPIPRAAPLDKPKDEK
jgi:hypothetical protein